jgi:hypothetical protein
MSAECIVIPGIYVSPFFVVAYGLIGIYISIYLMHKYDPDSIHPLCALGIVVLCAMSIVVFIIGMIQPALSVAYWLASFFPCIIIGA